MTGTCKFCGQTMEAETGSINEANEYASYYCTCTGGRKLRAAADAKDNVNELFGEKAVVYGFEPIADDEFINFLYMIIDSIAAGIVPAASVTFRGGRAIIKIGTNGKIKVQRISSNKCELES